MNTPTIKKADCCILFHKKVDYPLWENEEIWTPLEVGAALRDRVYEFGSRDNEGENISKWNDLFAETTGIYWLWKHLTGKKYAGQVQYRRRFDIHTEKDLDELFSKVKVIAAAPIRFGCSIRGQYNYCHNPEDMERIKNIIFRLYPEYEESWDKYIENGHVLFYSNGFIMLEEDFKRYCEWLFSILFEFKKEMGWESPEALRTWVENEIKAGKRRNANGQGKPDGALKYQSQLCGFISERLWTLYLLHNYKEGEIGVLNYLKMEPGI